MRARRRRAWHNMVLMKLPVRSRRTFWMRLLDMVKNPLVILLSVLALISLLTGDLRATIVILTMVILGVVLRFFQEMRADTAAQQLKAMVSTTATVLRSGQKKEISLKELTPGDIISLSAGDMVPADARVLVAKDLFINQSALTGESIPVEKRESFAGRRRQECIGTAKYLLPGVQRGKRNRHGGGRPHRQGHLFWFTGDQHHGRAPVHQFR